MRKEYDLARLKVKRRGPLEGLQCVPEAPEEKTGQVQVTRMMDKDVTQSEALSAEWSGSFNEGLVSFQARNVTRRLTVVS